MLRAAALLVAALAVTAAGRAAGPKTAPPAFGAADPELVGRTADYADFSDLIATIMVLREGGVDAAMSAVPNLHDETAAYIKTISLLATTGKNVSEWKGLSNAALAKLGGKKNWTENDPVKAWGDAVEAKVNATGKLTWDASADPKANATTTKIQQFADKVFGPDEDDDTLAAINAKLKKYNIEVTGKSISAPTKFNNDAAAISRAITGLSLGLTGVEFAPCLISYSVGGASFETTGLNINPVAFQFSNQGATVSVQGVNIQPSLILVQPVGFNVQPQGVQVAPFLVAVAPVGVGVQPAGVNIAPVLDAVTPVGKSIAPVGKSTVPVDIAYAPVDINLAPDDDHDHDHGKDGDNADAPADDPVPVDSGRRRRLAGLPFQPGKVNFMRDPLDLSNELPSDYRNWASVLSQVLLKKEGNADAATSALGRVMLDVHGSLARAADGEPFLPRFHLKEPLLLAKDGGAALGLPPLEATKFDSSANFINFSPCVLSESYEGLGFGATGLSFAPNLISITNEVWANDLTGINFNPNLIYVSTIGAQVNPQGINVQPALIYIGAIGANVQPQGINIGPDLINVAPVGFSVQPTGRLIAPAHKVFGPTHIGYGPVKEDTVEGPNPKIDLVDVVKKEGGKPGKKHP